MDIFIVCCMISEMSVIFLNEEMRFCKNHSQWKWRDCCKKEAVVTRLRMVAVKMRQGTDPSSTGREKCGDATEPSGVGLRKNQDSVSSAKVYMPNEYNVLFSI